MTNSFWTVVWIWLFIVAFIFVRVWWGDRHD
jgi:hypothetical protein